MLEGRKFPKICLVMSVICLSVCVSIHASQLNDDLDDRDLRICCTVVKNVIPACCTATKVPGTEYHYVGRNNRMWANRCSLLGIAGTIALTVYGLADKDPHVAKTCAGLGVLTSFLKMLSKMYITLASRVEGETRYGCCGCACFSRDRLNFLNGIMSFILGCMHCSYVLEARDPTASGSSANISGYALIANSFLGLLMSPCESTHHHAAVRAVEMIGTST